MGLEVHAAAEGVTRASHDDDIDRVVLLQGVPRTTERLVQLEVDRILRFGTVQPKIGDPILLMALQHRHGPCSRLRLTSSHDSSINNITVLSWHKPPGGTEMSKAGSGSSKRRPSMRVKRDLIRSGRQGGVARARPDRRVGCARSRALAGYTTGAIYFHYANKEELYADILRKSLGAALRPRERVGSRQDAEPGRGPIQERFVPWWGSTTTIRATSISVFTC